MEESWSRRRRQLAAAGPILFLTAFVLHQPVVHAREPLVWAADAEGGAPYIFKDPKNPERDIGFEVDLAEALSRELDRPIHFKQYEFQSLIPGLLRGDFDFAMNGLEVTPERQAVVRLSKPYYVYKLQLVIRADEDRFKTLNEAKRLGGIQVGTLESSAAERLLERWGVLKRSYTTQLEPYKDLEVGRIDAVLMDLPIALYYAKPNDKLKFAERPTGRGYYAIAFRKQDETLAAEFDRALERLAEKGELRRIYEKWNLWNDNQDELMPLETFVESGQSNEEPVDLTERWTFARYFRLLLEGAQVTVLISVLSMLLAIGLGLVIAVCRLYGPTPLRLLAVGYIEFFRGIPVLILLFFLYFGLAGLSQHYGLGAALQLTPLQAAILGFGLNYAAYEAEIYRAGISSIPVGQWEAGASLGMSGPLTFRRIILPQAIRTILPPMTNDFVALFKDTSVVSIIAVEELSKRYQILSKSTAQYVEIGLVTAALYLIMSVPLGYLSRYLEQRWSKALLA